MCIRDSILLGVARPELVELLAETLSQSHIRRAAVVYGAGGVCPKFQ